MRSTIKLQLLFSSCLLLALSLTGCKSSRRVNQPEILTIENTATESGMAALPPCLVYKTRADYASNVPVLLNKQKTAIISYPAPSDLGPEGKTAIPVALEQGYLLDNRGIAPNVAFLKYTYKEYASLKKVPGKEELFKNIIDKYPLIELWDCGTRSTENCDIERLNKLIREDFPGCKSIVLMLESPSL